jgi:acetyl-CoA C-acetyltransferase/acetyl-CoA acyltransferase 2
MFSLQRAQSIRVTTANRSFSTTKTAMSNRVFLVGGKRTPFGKNGESLKDIPPVELAYIATKALLEETQINPKKIDHSIMANVVPSTTDTIYGARHLALKVGAKLETPAYNVNRLCGSGIQAIVDAANYIRRGEANLVLASGVENMSLIPHLVYGARFGTRFGPFQTVDMLMDSLTDKHAGCAMAITAETLATDNRISREDCDEFSLQSHQRASQAYKDNLLQGEIAKVIVKKKGEIVRDEHIRPQATKEELAKLRSTFKDFGVVTPGTASGIVDGAGAVFVASEEFVNKEGITPLAEIADSAVVGVDPTRMGIGPVPAIKKLLQKSNLTLKDIDLVEINEAFAAQTLACVKELQLDVNKLNIWGGAIAIGHPLGASGIRIALTLARQLKHTGGKNGIASACIGGGQGIALHLKSIK